MCHQGELIFKRSPFNSSQRNLNSPLRKSFQVSFSRSGNIFKCSCTPNSVKTKELNKKLGEKWPMDYWCSLLKGGLSWEILKKLEILRLKDAGKIALLCLLVWSLFLELQESLCSAECIVQAEYKSVQGQGEHLSEGESLWNIKGWKILCVFM